MENMHKQNFTYPSYTLFVHNVLGTATKSWNELDSKFKAPSGWLALVKENGAVSKEDFFYLLLFTVFWSALRHILTSFVFKPCVEKSGLNGNEASKAPESAWKFLFYSCTWAYSIYILFFTKYNFFYDVPLTFIDWKPHSVVPKEIYVAYLVQLSFYVHSVYATLFVDVWRKDSIIMLLHHFVTMLLIGFSYVFRYTNVGILILFLHDITDILLEGTKLAVYYKTKGGYWHTVCDFVSTVGFILFGISWYVFRLYWFPLKAMYASGYLSKAVAPGLVFYHFFNGLLWMLLAMNIYWFTFIVIMAYKIITKQTAEVDDTREYSQNDDTSKSKKWE